MRIMKPINSIYQIIKWTKSTPLRTAVCLLLGSAVLITSGCATHQPIPKEYLGKGQRARLVIQNVPPAPAMMDSGQGGVVGAVITATSRANRMKQQLAGRHAENVQLPFTEMFKRRMAEHLELGDWDGDLKLVVNIDTWGWYVPTIDFGIKVGEYECQMIGRVDVYDNQNKRVAFAHLRAAEPLGFKPEEEGARNAVTKVAEQFAMTAETALIHLPKGR
jgi:hypothetical protein